MKGKNESCFLCHKRINKTTLPIYTIRNETVHPVCYQERYELFSTVAVITPEGYTEEKFDNDFRENDERTPGELPDPVREVVWKETTADKKKFVTWELKPGFHSIADGWMTAYVNDKVPKKREVADLFSRLRERKIIPPCPAYWLFGYSDNMFVTISRIAVRDEHEILFSEWLKTIGWDVAKLKDCLDE